jgi:hypothetical protein
MSTIDIHEFVKVANCYQNVAIAYRIILAMSVTFAHLQKEIFQS